MTLRIIGNRTRMILGGAIVATLGLSACGSSDGAEGAPAIVWGVEGGQSATYESSVERWNQANPDQQIELQMFGNDGYSDKLRIALGAGEGPALMFGWGGGVLESYAQEGYVDPLTDEAITGRYMDAVLDNVTFDGKAYGAAINNIQPVVILYNKEVFEAAGVEAPNTWDELLELVPVFNSQGIAPIALAGASKWPQLPYLSYLVDRIGGTEVFDAVLANEQDAWSDPAVLQALEEIQALVKAGGFNADYASVDYASGTADALLYSGKAAMMVVLSQAYSNISSTAPDFVAAGNLGYVPFPSYEGGKGDPATLVGNPSNFWSVTSAATEEHKATVTKFLAEEVMNEDYIGEILDRSAVPGVETAGALIADRPDNEFQTFVFDLSNNAPKFQLSWDQALTPVQGSELTTQLDRIFLLEITPEEFATAMNATIQ